MNGMQTRKVRGMGTTMIVRSKTAPPVITFDLAFQLSVGAACAHIRSDGPSLRRRGLVACACVYSPCAVISALAWPAWQSMGALTSPPWSFATMVFAAASIVALVAAYLAGFAAGRSSKRSTLSSLGVVWLLVVLTMLDGLRFALSEPSLIWFLVVTGIINLTAVAVVFHGADIGPM